MKITDAARTKESSHSSRLLGGQSNGRTCKRISRNLDVGTTIINVFRKHDQIDRMARDARRMRESEIIQIIVDSLPGSKSLTAS